MSAASNMLMTAQIIGNPNCMPTLQASASFNTTAGLGVIDGSPYGPDGLGFGATNTFFRQIRNLKIDTTLVPANESATGIHWPTAQTTSIQNVYFNMSAVSGTKHVGLFIEEGSGGFLGDLHFEGGLYGFNVGNQQFTSRNLTFNKCVTAINQLWDWGWTYKSVTINNCQVGLNISAGGAQAVNVGSITLIDSTISNTPIGIITARTEDSQPSSAGSIYLENVNFDNVTSAIAGTDGMAILQSPTNLKVEAWADGHRYLPPNK